MTEWITDFDEMVSELRARAQHEARSIYYSIDAEATPEEMFLWKVADWLQHYRDGVGAQIREFQELQQSGRAQQYQIDRLRQLQEGPKDDR